MRERLLLPSLFILTSVLVQAPLFLDATSAEAQIETGEFSSLTFRPAPGLDNYIVVPGASVRSESAFAGGAYLDVAVEPLEIFTQCEAFAALDCPIVGEKRAIVETTAALTLMGSYTFANRVQVGLSLPLVWATGQGMPFTEMGMLNREVPGGSNVALGDPRLDLKFNLLDTRVSAGEAGLAVALNGWATAPLAQTMAERAYMGDDGLTAGGEAIGEMWAGAVRLSVMLGGYYRPVRTLVTTEVGPMMSYGMGLEYRILEALALVADANGSTNFGSRIDQLEGRAALRLRAGSVTASVGMGLGIIVGPGVPDFRFLGGLTWAPQAEFDTDGDGLLDEADTCPDAAEDMDGFADEDGCPEADNDRDGINDDVDACPDDPEDMDDFEDEDGCPEEDNDGDGVRDGYDSCPNDPEDMDGDRDSDGCPDQDTDRDGIDDDVDQCPNEAEDTDGLADDDGCPEEDADHDEIPDDRDECPEHPEDMDGFRDRDGCPDAGGRIAAEEPA